MNTQQTCKIIGLPLDDQTLAAAQILEYLGKKFCVDFGTENAIPLADEAFRKWIASPLKQ